MRAFPFSAIVGQDDMKLALLLAAVDPSLGGVMVFGDRGIGQDDSGARPGGAAAAAQGHRGLPLQLRARCAVGGVRDGMRARGGRERADGGGRGAGGGSAAGRHEDRVVGALDLERALTVGEKAFDPGLLARAHRGFLYIDEVNLLEDHLVDLLLDVAASGENVVEREGLSVRHPARFVLVGSGNPEEGELRPQLLDRFGLSVEVRTPGTLVERVEVVRRRDAFDRDPAAFAALWAGEDAATRERVAAARGALPYTAARDAMLEQGSRLCMAIGADGLRGELTLLRAARALAALEGEGAVTEAHLRRVAPMALRHRLRRGPMDEQASTVRIERAMDELLAA
jgi:magnesium chelatase subunit I